ncbi:MAG: hypothetical protein IKT68_07630 [Clostridia bacterium]|nr:hypothetical protein [Clostridia bacterium]
MVSHHFWQKRAKIYSERIINRVLYDLTPKPIGTIEWG